MPKRRKIVRNLFLITGGFILLLVILAEIFKNDIVKMALQKGANTFDVPLGVGEVDFSLLYHFPLATIEFNDLVMLSDYPDSDSLMKQEIDTVAGIAKLYAAVDIVELIYGNILVKKIEIKGANVKYLVDSLGNSNFDFLLQASQSDSLAIEETDTAVVQGVYALEELTLSDINMEYVDEYMNFAGHLLIPELTVNGELTSEGYAAETEGELVIKSIHYDDFHLEELKHSSLTFNVTALNDTINVDELQLNAAGSVITANGLMVQGDSIYADLSFTGKGIDLTTNIALLPAIMLKEFKLNKAGGILDVSGTTKGYITPNSIPQFNIEANLKNGLVHYDIYPEVSNVSLSVSANSGYATGLEAATVNVKQFHAQTAQSSVDLSAIIQNLVKMQYDVVLDVKTNLSEIKAFVPDSLVKGMGGVIKAKISTSGIMPDSITDAFTDYALNRTRLDVVMNGVRLEMDSVPTIKGLSGHFRYQPGKVKLSGFKVNVPEYKVKVVDAYIKSSFIGKVSGYKHMKLKLDSAYVAMPLSSFAISGVINGFESVNYDLKSSVNIGLAEIKNMLPDSIANDLSGSIKANLISKGSFHVDSVADQAMALLFENSQFNVNLHQVSVDMPDTLMNVQSLSGLVSYNADTLWMNQVVGSYLGLDFSADSTMVASVYSAAIQNNKKELYVHGNFGAGDLDYAWVEGFMTDTVPMSDEEMQAAIDKAQEEEPYVQNFTTKVNGKASLRSFKYGDVLTENIDTKFLAKVDEGYFVADDLYCNVFDGEVKASVKYEMNVKDKKSKVKDNFRDIMHFKTDMQSVDVSRMLTELEEYIDQEDFKGDNAKGRLSSTMDGKIVLKDYEPVYDEMRLNGNLTLEEGALINVAPVMEIEKISMIGIKGLDNLRFSTINSNLFLFKNKMYISRTEIRTSSFDAMFLGMYSFGEDYAYHIRMFLGEILASKSKNNLSKQAKESGFDEEEEDELTKGRSSLYVVSKSEMGKEKAGLDNKKDRKKMTAKVKLQKQMVDLSFHPKLVKYSTED